MKYRNLRRKRDNANRRVKEKLTSANSMYIFPYDITLGTKNSTEAGFVDNSFRVIDFTTFNKLFDGLDNLLLTWVNSWDITVNEEGDAIAGVTGNLIRKPQVGEFFYGLPIDGDMGAVFEASAVSGDFTAMFSSGSFSIKAYIDVTDDDRLRWYRIPTISNKWFIIESSSPNFNAKGKIDSWNITFTTVDQKIADSGRAVEQFAQESEPGGSFTKPLINDNYVVELDQSTLIDRPITSKQIELAGPGAFLSMVDYGRPVKTETVDGITKPIFNEIVEASRLLLPYAIETATPSSVNTRPTAEQDYFVGSFSATGWEEFENWQQPIASQYNLSERSEFEGVFRSAETKDIVEATNPISNGTRQYQLWDRAWTFSLDKVFNSSAEALAVDELNLNSIGDMSLPEFLCHSHFGQNTIESLPVGLTQNTPYRLASIPLIGGIANIFTAGIPFTWNNESIRISTQDIAVIQPASIPQYGNTLMDKTNDTQYWIDLMIYKGADTNEITQIAGLKSIGTVVRYQMTDIFTMDIENSLYYFNTVDLGQTFPKFDLDNNEVVFSDPDNAPDTLLWDITCKPAPKRVPGYAIDLSAFKLLAVNEYRLSYYTLNESIWSGTFQTQSAFTENIRDISNAIKLSSIGVTDGTKTVYPANITTPPPPGVNNPVIIIADLIDNYQTNEIQGISLPLSAQNRWLFADVTTTNLTVIDIDTAPYGGLVNFGNNYQSLELTINDRQYSLDLNTIITNQITLTDTFENGQIFSLTWKLSGTGRNEYLTKELTYNESFILITETDNDVIRLTFDNKASNTFDNTDPWIVDFDANFGIGTTDWEIPGLISVTDAYFQPKSIDNIANRLMIKPTAKN